MPELPETKAQKILEVIPKPGEVAKGPEVIGVRDIKKSNISEDAIKRVQSGNAGFLTPNGPK